MPKFRIAIVGAGPAGYFTAQAFQKFQTSELSFSIDMLERLPTPWGLVRNGVAPDHPKIKTVSKVFEKIARDSGFNLYANVELGKDISLKDLRENYDAVVLATGSSLGRKLKIKGEELDNSLSAAEFVPWYNGHPDFTNLKIDLNCDTAVVIGAGNVALDVARMLVIESSKLDLTDTAEHALPILKSSNLRRVVICGRRGPEHASFTVAELRDFQKLERIQIDIDKMQLNQAILRVDQLGDTGKDLRRKLDVMQMLTRQPKPNAEKKIEIMFLAQPLEIKGNKIVEEIEFTCNLIQNDKVISSSTTFSIKAGLVISAIGYDAIAYPGVKIDAGRIVNTAGHVGQNIYVTGWAKRGPVGVIGTNKSDASDVVELIIGNLREPKNGFGIESLLKSGHQFIDQTGWEKINATEVIAGELVGKPRVKECDWKRLISLGLN